MKSKEAPETPKDGVMETSIKERVLLADPVKGNSPVEPANKPAHNYSRQG